MFKPIVIMYALEFYIQHLKLGPCQHFKTLSFVSLAVCVVQELVEFRIPPTRGAIIWV